LPTEAQQQPPNNETSGQIETPKSPEPGSEKWIYADEKLDNNIAKILSDYWDLIENTYVGSTKFVFRKLRIEKEQIIRYIYKIKSDFKKYIKRSDGRQEYVDTFIEVIYQISFLVLT
jgi:hypothetical protein